MLGDLSFFALTPVAVNVSIWSRNCQNPLEDRTYVCYYNGTKQEQAAPDRNEVAFMQHKNIDLMKQIHTEYSGLKRPGYRGSGTIVPQQ